MSMFVHEKVVVKTTSLTSADAVDSICYALEKEGFTEHINIAIEGNRIEFEINEDVNVSFDIRDLIEKIHKCNTNIQAVCSIDMDSNVGYYTVIASIDSPASVVYDIFSEFIEDVQRNLNKSLKHATLYLFRGQEKQ